MNWQHLKNHVWGWRLLLIALLLLMVYNAIPTTPAYAQDDIVRPAVSDPTWQGAYWNNRDLAGEPALVRSDATIDFDWGSGSPDPAIGADNFSARWTRYLYLEAGTYRFTATSDDGVRVFVNDRPIIAGWSDHPAQTFSADLPLASGHHLVRVEYYENADRALARFDWERISGGGETIRNWRGEYFNNRDLSGAPVLVRDDTEINFDWSTNSPAAGVVNSDNFSVRWTRTLDLPAGNYRFRLTVDDGARLWVNNALIIDQWREQGATTYTSDIYVPGGNVPVRLEYFEYVGGAIVRLNWERTDSQPPPSNRWRGEYFNNRDLAGTPALVRDDERVDFDWGNGSPARDVLNSDNFSARWTRTLDLPAGSYRFYVRVDDGARLWVNNRLLIDEWRNQPKQTYTADIQLPGGVVPVRLEYLEHRGGALVQLSWERIDSAGGGLNWRGEYFNNRDLSGSPVLVRDDRTIDFDWGTGSPASGVVTADDFSVRWTSMRNFSSGRYRFTTESDDGVRLYIDDRLVIDQWREQARTRHSVDVDLSRGNHRLRMEYFEKGGAASARLSWRRIGNQQPAPVGNIITCVPPQPENYAWIRLYRLDGGGNWYLVGRGIGTTNRDGYLKIDGLPVDTGRFGNSGEPYRVEQWIDGRVTRSTGNFQAGEPEFRVRPFADNFTPWQCR